MGSDPTTVGAMEVEEDPTRYCVACGYNLRGLRDSRCPECGKEFNPRELPVANLPWLRKGEIGILAGYLGTLHVVVVRPTRTLRELSYSFVPTWAAEDFGKTLCRVTATLCGVLGMICAVVRAGSLEIVHVGIGLETFVFVYAFCYSVSVLCHSERDPDPRSSTSIFAIAPLGLEPIVFLLLLVSQLAGNVKPPVPKVLIALIGLGQLTILVLTANHFACIEWIHAARSRHRTGRAIFKWLETWVLFAFAGLLAWLAIAAAALFALVVLLLISGVLGLFPR